MRYVADPAATLRELARVVRPGGCVANLEFAVPTNPGCGAPAWFGYTRRRAAAGRARHRRAEWYEVGRFLGPSISSALPRYPSWWLQDAWQAAGIEDVTVRPMSLGGGLVMWGRKRVD